MAWAKGPMEGHGAWGKEDTLKVFPSAVCKKVHGPYGIRGFLVYDKPGGRVIGRAAGAREAWCDAAGSAPSPHS